MAARLAREMGRVHPKDWVEVYESHTPYEWLLQKCLAVVDPWGDERADLRAAVHTMARTPSGDFDRNEMMDSLIGYLKINERQAVSLSPAQLRAMVES